MEACIRWGPDSTYEGVIIRGKDMPGHARRHSAVSCTKMAEPIDLPFELWTRLGLKEAQVQSCPHKLNVPLREGEYGFTVRLRRRRGLVKSL